jgi:hypothetical protein
MNVYHVCSRWFFDSWLLDIYLAWKVFMNIIKPICKASYVMVSYGHANHAFTVHVCSLVTIRY